MLTVSETEWSAGTTIRLMRQLEEDILTYEATLTSEKKTDHDESDVLSRLPDALEARFLDKVFMDFIKRQSTEDKASFKNKTHALRVALLEPTVQMLGINKDNLEWLLVWMIAELVLFPSDIAGRLLPAVIHLDEKIRDDMLSKARKIAMTFIGIPKLRAPIPQQQAQTHASIFKHGLFGDAHHLTPSLKANFECLHAIHSVRMAFLNPAASAEEKDIIAAVRNLLTEDQVAYLTGDSIDGDLAQRLRSMITSLSQEACPQGIQFDAQSAVLGVYSILFYRAWKARCDSQAVTDADDIGRDSQAVTDADDIDWKVILSTSWDDLRHACIEIWDMNHIPMRPVA